MKTEVLIIASEFPPGPGGIGNHAFSMAKALHNKGIDVTVLANGDYVDRETIARFDKDQLFKIIRYPDGKFGLKYIKRLFLAQKLSCSNVILSGKFSLWIGLWLKAFNRNINLISFLHGSEVNLQNLITRKLTHKAIANADKIVAVSNFTKQLLPDNILKSRDVVVIPNGIELNSLYIPEDQIKLEGNPAILTVGNVTPRKGQHRVIKLLPEILKIYPDAHYHIVGLPTYKDRFYHLAESLSVEKHITFHGRAKSQEELYQYYSAADVFTILSENQKNGDCEGFGIVILEAGFFSLPCIGAKGCGIEDAISDGYNGYLIGGDNAEEYCAALSKILKSHDVLGTQSKAWATDHDWNVIVNDVIQLFV